MSLGYIIFSMMLALLFHFNFAVYLFSAQIYSVYIFRFLCELCGESCVRILFICFWSFVPHQYCKRWFVVYPTVPEVFYMEVIFICWNILCLTHNDTMNIELLLILEFQNFLNLNCNKSMTWLTRLWKGWMVLYKYNLLNPSMNFYGWTFNYRRQQLIAIFVFLSILSASFPVNVCQVLLQLIFCFMV